MIYCAAATKSCLLVLVYKFTLVFRKAETSETIGHTSGQILDVQKMRKKKRAADNPVSTIDEKSLVKVTSNVIK